MMFCKHNSLYRQGPPTCYLGFAGPDLGPDGAGLGLKILAMTTSVDAAIRYSYLDIKFACMLCQA
jgi:hypothetical protein